MAIPNTSEKSNALDREENITKGNLSAKKVALYTYDANTDSLEPGVGGFAPNADITTDISNSASGVIVQTDGTKTLTITITGTTITEVWS